MPLPVKGAPTPPFGPKLARNADELAELKSIAADLLQLCLDIAGIADPTPISDGANALISLGRGNWFDAVLSGVSMVPYVGDLAKAGKFPRYLKTLEKAVVLASQSPKAAEKLKPILSRLDTLLDMIPDAAVPDLQRMKELLSRFRREQKVAKTVLGELPDISKRFNFPKKFRRGDYEYQEASGALGIPGKVKQHRSTSAQRGISGGTGDDAGHLIGNRFGAPGGAENLAPQNWIQNRGGTFKELENYWEKQLRNGTGVKVKVEDVFRVGEDRPFKRRVAWTEVDQFGRETQHSQIFANTHSPLSREKRGIPPTKLGDEEADVIDIFTRQKLN